MPAARWPGTSQYSVYAPGASFTVPVSVSPLFVTSSLKPSMPSMSSVCWIAPLFV